MALFEVKVEIPFAAAEPASEVLLERECGNWSVLDDVIARRAWVVGICPDAGAAQQQWDGLAVALAAAAVVPLAAPQTRPLADADWRDSYKAHFHAWRFGRLHWVPVWERETFVLPAGDAVLWLDPGLAFGTGNHETTRLCCERLVALSAKMGAGGAKLGKRRVVDAGCGSGILALSAAKLGFTNVVAFDNDPEAVRVSEENAALNDLAGHVKFFAGDLTTGLVGEQADILLANIQADVLQRFAKEIVAAIAPEGIAVLSGILAVERDVVRATFESVRPGCVADTRVMGEWCDLVLTRP